MENKHQYRLAIFASGGGSNARAIFKYFENHQSIKVVLVISNKSQAGVHQVAASYGVESIFLPKSQLSDQDVLLSLLHSRHIDFLVLAGYLLLIPDWLIAAYPDKIFNIHPSLLPKYGGKGMYGHHVHEAVKSNQETESGMTIHLVNEEFDKGEILFQAKINVEPEMTADDIAAAVLILEHENYAPTIEKFILGIH
jgi:phosphoribosylglycinamide formyltransferase-1